MLRRLLTYTHAAPADLIDTQSEISQSSQRAEMAHATVHTVQSKHTSLVCGLTVQLCLSTTFIFHVYSVVGCYSFRDSLIVQSTKKRSHYQLSVRDVVYVHVWQMGHMCGLWWQAGWSLRFGGGLHLGRRGI